MITAVGLILGATGAALIWSAVTDVSLIDEVRAAFDGQERAIGRIGNDPADLDLPPKATDAGGGGGGSFGGGGGSGTWGTP